MNERIKLLAEQAGFSFKYKTAPDEMNPGHKLKDLKKFAELIVRECVGVCKSRVGNRDYNTGRLHCVSDIRERFGLDGMSTEDKKTLIKELLGVKND